MQYRKDEFDKPGLESLTAVDRSEIEKAKASLKVKRHAATPDKIISDLSFGFWVSLLNTRHEQAF